ncbi:serine/threonine protein kinase [Nostoc linckia z18]|uniref:non-specific serine/threonine protein kinase n=3 Tax=Nostoc linckia TaxID=92942 RepID=A0A9Q6EHF9_NOSLI|nr:serine/threonine protein kinase [Nostoc linckia]PHK40544.1 serine/threonine protein kinase [Nostoc linckia z16]PHJ55370.1 serine/threonine protein kinase [Nostoc linckia z1]PHJ56779.1 serine/threonine protein kinase [Nostoc linckia z3]PHJ57834.1 serine/threonine protein kinase [Nostoc linckia z2]PHJ74805.1 serine/threonine protein kinase [Nostoc linckia z4]
MIGKLLDHRYQIIRVLATGGFGQTYIAEDTRRPGNPVCVVKHLKPGTDPRVFATAKRLFNSEAETLEKLGNHDQIPRLLAYFDENQEFYLVQEYVEGHTLAEELLPGKRWSESQVIQLLQEVLAILEFVHQQGVIHRDIKPDNIIRRTSDNKFVLVDFGAVKQLRTQMVTVGGQGSATVVIGTPGYMPTEQGQGKPRPNSDIYSLGIIAIQALTGLPATELQEDPETGEIIWRHSVTVNPRLAAVLAKMVRYHFKDRYQTATEALQACQNAINPVIAISRPQEAGKNFSTQATKPRRQVVSRQHTLAVAPANHVPPRPVHQTSKSDPWPILIGILLAGGAAALVANVYPNVKNLAANFTGSDRTLANKCSAIVVGNSNIRSEPSSINSGNIVQTVGNNTSFEVTGKQTKRGWIEVKLKSGNSAWAHQDVVANKGEWTSCLREKGIATKIVDDSTLITTRPLPQVKPKSKDVVILSSEKSNSSTSDNAKSQPNENSTQILEQAKKKYDSGDVVGAIALLKSIPTTAASDIQETRKVINQWQEDWTKANALFNDINQALESGQWDKVLDYKNHPEKLPNTQYWRNKIEPLFKQAAENLAKQALEKIDSQVNQKNPQKQVTDTKQSDTTKSSKATE